MEEERARAHVYVRNDGQCDLAVRAFDGVGARARLCVHAHVS